MTNHGLPFFSVIIPTYERPAQLAECLLSLSLLDYPREKFEVVVVDDGSRVSPVGVVGDFSERMNIRLLTQLNAGPAAARNFGAAHARGELLAFTDDDCTPDAAWLRALAASFRRLPDRIVGGRTLNALASNLYSETSQLIIDVVYAHFNPAHDDALFFASNNLAVSAARFREIGGFDTRFTTSEDREVCDRWLSRGWRLTYAPEALVYHAHHLTLRTLWRQHFGYGRGALRFHRARREREATGPFRPDLIFYLKLFRASTSRARAPRRARLTALLFWSQLANTAGFFYERMHLHAGDARRARTRDARA